MNYFFTLFFVVSFIGSVASIISIRRKNKNKADSRRIQSVLLVFIISAAISFVGMGATAVDIGNSPDGSTTGTISESQAESSTDSEATSKYTSESTTKSSSQASETTVTTAETSGTGFTTSTSPVSPGGSAMSVHFIDVGQGDSILIIQDDFAMLIDAGDNNKGRLVVNYIREQGIERLEYVIGTHPHADHIGGLSDVINELEIGRIILPDISHTTKTFEDMLLAIQKKDLRITKAVHGESYVLGLAIIDILGPITVNANDLNNASVVCKISFGETAFMFTGDIEVKSESEILRQGYDLSADVLKVSHHGSSTSSLPAFLSAVNPEHAVILCGEGNRYNHPSRQTLDNLSAMNIKVYRTDLAGTIVAITDGKNISFNVNPKLGTAGGSTSPPSNTVTTEAAAKETTTTATTKETTSATTKSETVTGSIGLISITDPFVPGSTATVKVKGQPDTQYSIVVNYKSGTSSAAGLDPKTSDSEGYVSWTWNVGSRTSSGSYHLVISGGGQEIKVDFTVK